MSEYPSEQTELIDLLERFRNGNTPRQFLPRLDQILRGISNEDGELSPDLIRELDEFVKVEFSVPLTEIDTISSKSLSHGERRIKEAISYFVNKREFSYPFPELDIDHNSKVVFLLGAGASQASGIPTVNGLLDELLDQARRTRRDDLEPLIEYCEGREDIDIEDLLTAAYLSDLAITDRHIVRLLHYFLFSKDNDELEETPSADVTSVNFIQDTLQILFGLITSTMIPKDPNETHVAIREFIDSHENTSIITTNYDYCMDEELLGNGFGLEGTIDDTRFTKKDRTVKLLKMHGSINWPYCESCQSTDHIEPVTVKQSFEDDSLDYPVIGICPECKGRRRPLLVPPISFKFMMFPPLIDIWNQAKEALIEADYIISVGYSFSDSDAYIYKLVSKSMTDQPDTSLVNINPSSGVTNRLRERFSTDLTDFDSKTRIIGLPMKSEEAVPKLVENMIDGRSSSTKQQDTTDKNTVPGTTTTD